MKKDYSTLKAWCHWKRAEKDLPEDDVAFIKDVEDLISLVGTLQARLDKFEQVAGTHQAVEDLYEDPHYLEEL